LRNGIYHGFWIGTHAVYEQILKGR
jgi:hypothetical protein